MNSRVLNVAASGIITLGPDVACDGFHRDYGVRVQTHVHLDHMHNFHTSKGLQDIYLSEATYRLLVAEFNADLLFRDNLIPLQCGEPYLIRSSRVQLLPSEHMLGSVQVAVELPDGVRVGYSGDFHWPLDEVIQVDQLVVDSTYGSSQSVRQYSQEEAEQSLLELATDKLRYGPLHIKAHRGTLHRGLQVLSAIEGCPMLASPRLCGEVEVYRAFGYPIGMVCSVKSNEAVKAIKEGRYIRFYGTGDQFPIQPKAGTTFTLSAFMASPNNPVMEYSERALNIAMSNHADFAGTLNYIQATGAQFVLTDNSRGGHAVELAQEIQTRLGIEARPSELMISHEWGI